MALAPSSALRALRVCCLFVNLEERIRNKQNPVLDNHTLLCEIMFPSPKKVEKGKAELLISRHLLPTWETMTKRFQCHVPEEDLRSTEMDDESQALPVSTPVV